MILLYVAAGGAIGAALRYLVNVRMTAWLGAGFPYGTVTVNVAGSLLMGLLVGYLYKTLPHSMALRAFWAVGVLGGFTTFSAFSLDAINLMERGQIAAAALYVTLSVLASIGALFIGLYMVRQVV